MNLKQNELLYLSQADVAAIDLPMAEMIAALEKMFSEKAAGRTEMPPKPGIHPKPDAFIHAMPAYVESLKAAGIKWVAGYPQNSERKLPYIHGLLVLNDPETGIPCSIMDANWITAMRTGAATALAAKYLARPESETAGILACGVQGRANLEALKTLFPIKAVRAYDINRKVAEQFASDACNRYGIVATVVTEPEAAVREMDLVVTSGPILKNPQPTIPAGWLKEGAFASAVDFDSYWTPEALREINKIVTDDLRQFQYYQQEGYFKQTPTPSAELAHLIAGTATRRETAQEKTMALNLGIGLEDVVCGKLIFQRALELNRGTVLPL